MTEQKKRGRPSCFPFFFPDKSVLLQPEENDCQMIPMIRYVYVALGILSCALGVIGIFVPLLPTTPFLLLSAALFFRSSPRLYNRLLNHPQLGPYIRNFREHKAIPLRVKIISVSLVWITILHAVIFLLDHWVLESLLLLLAAGITAYILHFKTLR
jgi:uncharacterized membrane protein YbaN (DUF454 family)